MPVNKLLTVGLFLFCLQYRVTVQCVQCDVYPKTSYDRALCDALIDVNTNVKECFTYPYEETITHYQALRMAVQSAPDIIEKFMASSFINKSCLNEEGLSKLDDYFFTLFRISAFVKQRFKATIRQSFQMHPIPRKVNIIVPGSGVFFEASGIFELFSPTKVLAIDPDRSAHEISKFFYPFSAYRDSIDLKKLEHIVARIGLKHDLGHSDKSVPRFQDNSFHHVAFFIHPGPFCEEGDSLNSEWSDIFTFTLDHLYRAGTAIFIFSEKKHMQKVKRFLTERADYKERSAFCQEGLPYRPFLHPDSQIYKCVLNIVRLNHDEL